MPGFGIRTTARVLLEIGDIAAFPTPGHLAAYAGLAPVTRRSDRQPYQPPLKTTAQNPQAA